MDKSMSVTVKLAILLLFALIFGATMIAFSVKDRETSYADRHFFDKSKSYEKKFTVSSGDKLVLEADLGDVVVTGTDGEELSVKVTANGSDENLSKYDVQFDQDGNTVRIRGKHSRRYFHFFDNDWMEVRYEITLPKNFNLELNTSGGDLNLRDIQGNIYGETSGGDVAANNLSGKIHCTTSGGNIVLKNSSGELDFRTSGGDIHGDAINGSMQVETSGGNIDMRNSDGQIYASTSGGDIEVELKDNKGINLSTSGGNIKISLPKTISGKVSASTTGGDVSCDFPFSGKIKDGNMNGTINGGGNLIEAETSGGDITIIGNE